MPSHVYDFIFADIPNSVKEQCLRYPWFANLIHDPMLKAIETPGRQPDYGGSYALISRTLKTPDIIAACQSFLKLPSRESSSDDDEPDLGEMLVVYCLEMVLEGYDCICRGGFLSMAMAHAIGSLARASSGGINAYTRHVQADFQRPLYVPGPLLCRTWITKDEGRKLWIRSRMKTSEGIRISQGKASSYGRHRNFRIPVYH